MFIVNCEWRFYAKKELLNYSKVDYLKKLDSKKVQYFDAYGGKCAIYVNRKNIERAYI